MVCQPFLYFKKDGARMFQTGDYIIYGSRGVCQISGIGALDISGADKKKLYYTLKPCYMEGSTIYAPVEQGNTVMRAVMTKEEVMELIREIPQIEELWIKDERSREFAYKTAIKGCDNRELVRIIKTIYNRGRSRMAEGKKVTVADNKYFRMAEENLYGELAISLDMTRDEVKKFVTEQVKGAAQKV